MDENIETIVYPSPETKYYYRNKYLKEITDLIIEKLDEDNDLKETKC